MIFALAMIVHIIRPFGVPGLRRREDAWKLAVIGLALFAVVVMIRPE